MKIRTTIKKLAETSGKSEVSIRGLLTFLRETGAAKETDEVVRSDGAKGRGAVVWEIDGIEAASHTRIAILGS